jgi:hypothetical protein
MAVSRSITSDKQTYYNIFLMLATLAVAIIQPISLMFLLMLTGFIIYTIATRKEESK